MVYRIYQNVRLRSDWYLLCVICTFTVASGLIPGVTSVLTGRIFGLLQMLVEDSSMTKSEFLQELTKRSMALAAVGACSIPIAWLSITYWMLLGERQGFRLREMLLRKYFDRELSWYDQNQLLSGDFVQINRCVEEVRSSSAEASAIILQNIVTILVLIGISMYFSWSLTLIILCTTPLLALLAVIFSKMVEKYSMMENVASSRASEVLSWFLEAFQMIRLLNTKNVELSKFRRYSGTCMNLFVKSCFYSSLNISMLRFLSLTMFAQGFWYGNTQIKKGNLKADDVITCFSSCLLLGSSLSNTLQQLVTIQKGKVAMERITSYIFAKKSHDKDLSKRHSIVSFASSVGLSTSLEDSDIILENVSFAYPTRPDDYVLKGINMRFPSNKTTFVCGRSGSGKSTLFNLVLKFYDKYEGRIKIGNYDIEAFDVSWLLQNITLVEQKCTLFNDSLKNNILLGNSNANDDLIRKACQFSLLGRMILDLPQGWDTIIGKDGVSLSGGQQQRVALARAYIKDSPILILDESISGLDVLSRSLIMEAIKMWRKNKTTIILTHEYTAIEPENMVYFMEDGHVVEFGLMSDLLKSNISKFGQYYNLQKMVNHREQVYHGSEIYFHEDKRNLSAQNVPKSNYFRDSHLRASFLNLNRSTEFNNFLVSRKGKDRVKVEEINSTLEKLDDLENQKDSNILPLLSILKIFFKTNNNSPLVILGLISSIIAGALNPLFSYVFSKLLTGIAPTDSGENSSTYLAKWSGILIGVSAADGIFTFLKEFLLGYSSEAWITKLRMKATAEIAIRSIEWFSHRESSCAELSSLLMNDLRDLRALASEFLSASTNLISVASIGLIWALVTGWKLGLVCLSLFPLFLILTGTYGSLLQVYETSYKSSIASLESQLYEIVLNIKTIKCMDLCEHFEKNYLCLQESTKQLSVKRAIATGFGVALTNALTLVTQAVLFYYGIKLVITQEYTSEQMFETFTLLLFSIMTSVTLINQIPEISRGQRAATYIFKLVDESEPTYVETNDGGLKSSINQEYAVEISDLSFSYPSAPMKIVYSSLSLKVIRNEVIGIVGESGSGKSTLAMLLTKLYPVPSKTVFVGELDVREWDTNSLRKAIAVVEQKPKFFDGSIRENLEYGNEMVCSEARLYEVLELLKLDSFVEKLPDQLDTRINTDLMSGGQSQRLSIARSLLSNPKILILDECTSALDSMNTFAIAELIKTKLKDITIIVLTHSEQMMQICDRLLVFKKGKVVEEGAFCELYTKKGELFRIVAMGKLG